MTKIHLPTVEKAEGEADTYGGLAESHANLFLQQSHAFARIIIRHPLEEAKRCCAWKT
jgi:hypothetical protein